jgi:hypothetical protein
LNVTFDGSFDPERQASKVFEVLAKANRGGLSRVAKAAKADTTKNHLKQLRGPDGKFIKKGK